MIITPSMLENSKRVLGRIPDGSKSNSQARDRAKKIINAHADNLQHWLDKNPNSPIALNLSVQIATLRLMTKD